MWKNIVIPLGGLEFDLKILKVEVSHQYSHTDGKRSEVRLRAKDTTLRGHILGALFKYFFNLNIETDILIQNYAANLNTFTNPSNCGSIDLLKFEP